MFTLHRIIASTVTAGGQTVRRRTYTLLAEAVTLAGARRAAKAAGSGRYVAGDRRGRQYRFEVVERVRVVLEPIVVRQSMLRLASAN